MTRSDNLALGRLGLVTKPLDAEFFRHSNPVILVEVLGNDVLVFNNESILEGDLMVCSKVQLF